METPVVHMPSKETLPEGPTRTPIAQDFLSLVRSLNAPGGFEAEEDELAAEDTPDAQTEPLPRLDDATGAQALEGGKNPSSSAGGPVQATEHRDPSQHSAHAHAEEHAEEHVSRRVLEAEEETPLCCVCTEPLEAGTDASDEWVYTAALRVDSHVASELLQVPLGSWVHEDCCPAMGLHAVAVLQRQREPTGASPAELPAGADLDLHHHAELEEDEEEQEQQEERARGGSPAMDAIPGTSSGSPSRDGSPWRRGSRSCSPMAMGHGHHESLEAARHSSIITSANRRLQRQREAVQAEEALACVEEQEPPGGYDPERPERQHAHDDNGEVVAWGRGGGGGGGGVHNHIGGAAGAGANSAQREWRERERETDALAAHNNNINAAQGDGEEVQGEHVPAATAPAPAVSDASSDGVSCAVDPERRQQRQQSVQQHGGGGGGGGYGDGAEGWGGVPPGPYAHAMYGHPHPAAAYSGHTHAPPMAYVAYGGSWGAGPWGHGPAPPAPPPPPPHAGGYDRAPGSYPDPAYLAAMYGYPPPGWGRGAGVAGEEGEEGAGKRRRGWRRGGSLTRKRSRRERRDSDYSVDGSGSGSESSLSGSASESRSQSKESAGSGGSSSSSGKNSQHRGGAKRAEAPAAPATVTATTTITPRRPTGRLRRRGGTSESWVEELEPEHDDTGVKRR